jgi:menaquinone-dependent protoporphyrinogen oxidase
MPLWQRSLHGLSVLFPLFASDFTCQIQAVVYTVPTQIHSKRIRQDMAKILIMYSTTDGHTLEICQYLKQVIERNNNRVTLHSMDDESNVDMKSFDKIVLGASIRYGKHSKQVYEHIKRSQQILDSKPNAFFSVNVVARKPGKNHPETNPYLKKFLKQISWQPKQLAVFAGKLDYPSYHFWDKQIIRFIMWMTKGPTDPETVIDFTDWKQVESFGQLVSDM